MKKQQRDQSKRQERALKKRTQRKVQLAQRQVQPAARASASSQVRLARRYPIEGCWTQRGWADNGLAVIVIARRQPDENLVFGNYLVDYYCLGVKNTYCNANVPPSRFHQEYLPRLFSGEPPVKISPALAHEVIYGSIEYAAQFGFQPHRDFKVSQDVLDPPDLHPRSGTMKFGKDGKPFYVAGPHDNAHAILTRLSRAAGEGNFHYLIPVGPLSDDLALMAEDDDEDDDKEEPGSLLWTPRHDDSDDDEGSRPVLWTPRR